MMPWTQPIKQETQALQLAVEQFLAGPKGFERDIWDGFALDELAAQFLVAALKARDPQVWAVLNKLYGQASVVAPATATEVVAAEARGFAKGLAACKAALEGVKV